MNRSNYRIIEDPESGPLIIEDVGPWNEFKTVTNDVENVVKELSDSCLLLNGRKLFYFDSEGSFDEILYDRGIFKGFAPARKQND